MNFARPAIWIVLLIAFVAVIILLRGILLPFVAAFILAYLLNPLANKIDRVGVGRLLATLAIVIPIVIMIVVLLVLAVPIIVRELAQARSAIPETTPADIMTSTNMPPRISRQAYRAFAGS